MLVSGPYSFILEYQQTQIGKENKRINLYLELN